MTAPPTLVMVEAIPLFNVTYARPDAEIADVVGWLDGSLLVVTSAFFSAGINASPWDIPAKEGATEAAKSVHFRHNTAPFRKPVSHLSSPHISTDHALTHHDGAFKRSGDTTQHPFIRTDRSSKIRARHQRSNGVWARAAKTVCRALCRSRTSKIYPCIPDTSEAGPKLTFAATSPSIRPRPGRAEMRGVR